jgi:hypothetical protein
MLETYSDPCRPDSKLSLSETMRGRSQRWRRDAGLEANYLSVYGECNVSSSYCQVPRTTETVFLGVTAYLHSKGHASYFSIISCSFFSIPSLYTGLWSESEWILLFLQHAYPVKRIFSIRGYAVSNSKNDISAQNYIKCHLTEIINNRITLYKRHAAILAECNKLDSEALLETNERADRTVCIHGVTVTAGQQGGGALL